MASAASSRWTDPPGDSGDAAVREEAEGTRDAREAGAGLREEPYRGRPEVPGWRDALAREEWQEVERGLLTEADPERRSLLVDRLVDKLARLPALDAWVAASGERDRPPRARRAHGASGLDDRGAVAGSVCS